MRTPFRWAVKALFLEPLPQPGQPVKPEGGQPSPAARPPWIRGSSRREDVFRGVDNTPTGGGFTPRRFVNSAGDLFDNPPALPFALGQFVVTVYSEAISYGVLRAYENACNSDTWNWLPATLTVYRSAWSGHRTANAGGWAGRWTSRSSIGPVAPEQKEIPNLAVIQGLVGGVVTGGWPPDSDSRCGLL